MTENRLGQETSPYLLQHQDNPVHWWAWGPEALAEAKRSNRPILLSVGYAACHWCHVMAHESFEDEATARVMNELFVNIKVDREERPDIDAIYMGALHRIGEHGGWPLTMFLDPSARPFWGGTYFPRESRWGRPAFVDVLRNVSRVFHDESDSVAHNAELLTKLLAPAQIAAAAHAISDAHLADLTKRLVRAVDPVHGGIVGAPKFPQWSFFWLLWRGGIRYGNEPAKAAVVTTLRRICQGGIYDHLGGGFARYSTDERWLAPHFEKMLYDNALLVDLMTEVWRETQDPLLAVRVAETVAWLEREMIAEGGGFAASLDADSEGVEGKFYVWTEAEILEVLGAEDAAAFAAVYDVTAEGNWEDHTILNRLAKLELGTQSEEQRLVDLRTKLLARRGGRVRPGWDDKVLADWNGLMIAALGRAARVFGRPEWVALAKKAFAFVRDNLGEGGALRHSYRQGRAKAPGTASDYANMIWAALRLHQATAERSYLDAALGWTGVLDRRFWDEAHGGYFMTADNTDDVIVRLKAGSDDATPNANAVMVANLVALSLLTGESRHAGRAERILDVFSADLAERPAGHTGLLANAMDVLAPQLVVIAGDGAAAGGLGEALDRLSVPGALEFVLGAGQAMPSTPALAGKDALRGRMTAYACLGPQCSMPIAEPEQFRRALKDNRSVPSKT